MEIENKIDPNGKTRTALTFFNTEYEIERDYGSSKITLWPSNSDLEEIFTDPGPMGCNMYPKIKRIEPNGYRQDSIDAFRYCIDDWTKAKQQYDRMVRASWNTKPEIVDVIFNDPATIVFWSDETKTVVKCNEDDEFDPEKGLTMAIIKKLYGPTKNLKKWLPEEKEEKIEVKPLVNNFIGSSIAEAVNSAINSSDIIKDQISKQIGNKFFGIF